MDSEERIKVYNITEEIKGYQKEIAKLKQENKQLKETINEVVEILGEYKHYSTPTEEQNSKNEDVVDKVYEKLKGSDINE